MKSGGPWNLRGLRPETLEVARDAARRSGMSVGEWLNSVIQPGEQPYDEQTRIAARGGEDDDGRRNETRRERYETRKRQDRHPDRRQQTRQEFRREPRQEFRREPRQETRQEARPDKRQETRHEPHQESRQEFRHEHRAPKRRRHRHPDRDHTHESAHESAHASAHASAHERNATLAPDEFGEVRARLNRLTRQLERMVWAEPSRLTGAPVQPQPGRSVAPPVPPPPPEAPRPWPGNRSRAFTGALAIDDAIAEINARQRTLYAGASAATAAPIPTPTPAPMPAPAPTSPVQASPPPVPSAMPAMSEPSIDISRLGDQLRQITTRIESLRPTSDFEMVIAAVRADLAEIRRQFTEALPRHAVESLEIEVRALAQRIDHSRASGVDSSTLVGLERGLTEVRDALRGLTPAENLVGFDHAVKTLTQKLDLIVAKEDPAALQQLETAIAALRGIVSHVASNDTLTKVAEDVRALAAKVDDLAKSAASGHAVSLLENRLDTLTNALKASSEAGQAVPRELEKLLGGLIEKLEWVQLTQTDHAAMAHLEDRIAQLIKRLDVSDARLGNLEAVERGLADLLVHLDQIRDVAEIKRSERRTQDSLEAVHGTVEQVVDRLAMIESDMHEGVPSVPPTVVPRQVAPQPVAPQSPRQVFTHPVAPQQVFTPPAATQQPRQVFTPPAATQQGAPGGPQAAAPRQAPAIRPPAEPADVQPAKPVPIPEPAPAPSPPPVTAAAEPSSRRAGIPRQPLNPNLPPDHPLEPGSASGPRAGSSAAERIAASEAAASFAKPPVIAEPGDKPNFIAAARRAAQAAAAALPEPGRQPRAAINTAEPASSTPRLRKLLVVGGAVLILFGVGHIALHLFQDTGAVAPPPPEHTSSFSASPEIDSMKEQAPQSGPLVLPVPSAPADTPSSAMPGDPQGAAPEAAPSENSSATPVAPAAPVPPAIPSRQSALHDSADITGSLPHRMPPPSLAPASLPPPIIAPAQSTGPSVAVEKLPATIGGPNLRAAALAGDAAAEFEVAMRFAEGRTVPPSNEEAARWFDRAAKQGLAPAQFRLGGFYEKGTGVKKDLAAARDLYSAAAAKGNGKAMHNLAVLYAEGVNGPADYHTAAHWFHTAADHGVTDSQYNLAILYARGIGVEQNNAEAYKWFTLAATQGDNEAAKKRDEVASHLDPQALAAAQLAVQKWVAEPQPDDAINVKSPPGGWDPAPQTAKAKPRSSAMKPQSL